jgi:hypothetical protein
MAALVAAPTRRSCARHLPDLRIVRDSWEQPAQLDRGQQFAELFNAVRITAASVELTVDMPVGMGIILYHRNRPAQPSPAAECRRASRRKGCTLLHSFSEALLTGSWNKLVSSGNLLLFSRSLCSFQRFLRPGTWKPRKRRNHCRAGRGVVVIIPALAAKDRRQPLTGRMALGAWANLVQLCVVRLQLQVIQGFESFEDIVDGDSSTIVQHAQSRRIWHSPPV